MKNTSFTTRLWIVCVAISISPLSVFAGPSAKKLQMRSLINQAIEDQRDTEKSFSSKREKPFKRVRPNKQIIHQELDALFEDRKQWPRKKRTITRKSASN